MEPKKILVPMDFSKCAKNGLQVAIDLATRWNSKLHILHAVHLPNPHMSLGELVVEPIAAEYEHQMEEHLAHLKDEFPALQHLSVTTSEYLSRVEDAIYTELEKESIDLVVMGTRAEHDLLEKLIGTTTSDVIDFAKVPVLVIPETTENFHLKRIGVAVDGLIMDKISSLELVSHFAEIHWSQVQIFNVTHTDERLDFELNKQSVWYHYYFSEVPHSFHHAEGEKVAESIALFAEAHQLDMLVMFPKHHSFFDRIRKGSTTKQVLQKLKIPLLSIHQ